MPIRLCQKCGLKVLIDESQAGTNPFYCQRCTTAMKGQENASAVAPAIKNPTPSPVANMANRSDPAAPSVGAAKAATVRVLCPYCKASFNGRVPQKPARGSCPVCQKELILLPNGDIKPAAGFDLGTYQNEGPPSRPPEPAIEPAAAAPMPKESGTRLLVKKYAAEQPARPAAKRSEPMEAPAPVTAPAETDNADDTNPLPGWLDDSAQGADLNSPEVKAQPETDVNVDVVEPPPSEEIPQDLVEDPPPPPPPPPRLARSPIAAKQPSVSPGRPPASIEPEPAPAEPEVDLLPPDPPPRKQTGRIHKPPPQAAPMAASSGEQTGGGKVFLAFFLTILPILAGAGLLSSRDKLHSNDLVKKIGTRLTVGFGKLHLKLFPPPPPPPAPKIEEKKAEPEPPKEEPPKPDPEQQKKDELKISQIADQCRLLRRKLKENTTAATPAQQAEFQKVRDDLAQKEAKIKELRAIYQKMYGKDYDPDKQ
jgi:hypothetical protein